jgi:hypothetical protein
MFEMELQLKLLKLSDLKVWERNYRRGDIDAICRSIRTFGLNGCPRVRGATVYAGNHCVLALRQMQESGEQPPTGVVLDGTDWHIRCVMIDHLTEREAQAFAIADNRTQELGTNDESVLKALLDDLKVDFDLNQIGFSETALEELFRAADLDSLKDAEGAKAGPKGGLSERFGVAPFSVLNAREGWWQERKIQWLRLGIDSEVGRPRTRGGFHSGPNIKQKPDGSLQYSPARGWRKKK